jgi:hypothetical protein
MGSKIMKDKKQELNEKVEMVSEAIEVLEVIEALEPVSVLSTIKASALIDVSTWKEKQLKLVAENTFFEIIDNKTYELGKKHRTNVVKGRTELQNQDKLVASKFASIRKEVGAETSTLIEITQPLEDKWQEAVKAWEDRKAKEKKESEEAEALRVKTINDKIEEIETSCHEIIQKMTFSEIDLSKTQLFAFFTIEFDFEEYDILFEHVKSRVELALEQKINSLTVSENQRLDNIRLEAENAEVKRISELQSSRLTDIMPYVAFGQYVDLTKLSELTKDEWELVFDAKKALFDADAKEKQEAQEKLDAENLEKENKSKADKDAIFEIRKNRLSEIGFDTEKTISGFFIHPILFDGVDADALFNLDAIWFETIITDSKLAIEKAKSDAEEVERQKAIDLQLAEEDAAKLKAENKARIKKYASDKKTLTEFVKSLEFRNAVPEVENEEIQVVLDKILWELENCKGFLLTEINLF